MADEPKVPDIPGGETEARIEALVEVVYELLALEDQEALKGVLAPLVFSRVGIDPAVASGPFITTTNDILRLFIYLGLATILVQRFYVGG